MLIILSYTCSLTLLLFGRKYWYFFWGFLLTVIYIFSSNNPQTYFGIDEFSRYAKETIYITPIIYLIYKVYISKKTFFSPYKNKKHVFFISILFLFIPINFYQGGTIYAIGYIRGIIFPIAICYYLISIPEKNIYKLGFYIRNIALATFLFIAIMALIHILINQDILIPNEFRNRLDYSLKYTSIVQYEGITRYQSFFGDPNRYALITIVLALLSMWQRTFSKKLLIIIICTMLIIWSESRSSIFSLLFIFAMISKDVNITKKERKYFKIVFSIIVSIALLASYLQSSRHGGITELSRFDMWLSLIQSLLQNPTSLLIGNGFGWIGQSGGTIVTSDSIEVITASGKTVALYVIDNSYLTIASTSGIIVFFIYFKLIFNFIKSNKKNNNYFYLSLLFAFYGMFFDLLVSFPWVFTFPLILRIYATENTL